MSRQLRYPGHQGVLRPSANRQGLRFILYLHRHLPVQPQTEGTGASQAEAQPPEPRMVERDCEAMKEHIQIAAIRWPDGRIFTGLAHPYCFKHAQEHGYEDCEGREEGFLTNTDRFVDRTEAARIAVESGQLPESRLRYPDMLFSEDLLFPAPFNGDAFYRAVREIYELRREVRDSHGIRREYVPVSAIMSTYPEAFEEGSF